MPDPWFKFYPRDWTADAQLNRCSLASREVWLRMTLLMREADPFGFFVGRNGEAIDLVWFAREVNATLREVKKCMADLDAAGVFSRDSLGRIYSRRMVREHARVQQLQENGMAGGNPSLLDNQRVLVNQNPNPLVNQDSLRLDNTSWRAARSHIPETTDSLRSSALGFRVWPGEIPKLRELALLFIAAFGNCRDAVKAEKYLPHYTQVLAQMRSRGVTIGEAWQACTDAREANNGKPLFASAIKTAMSFLPARGVTPQGRTLRTITAADLQAMP